MVVSVTRFIRDLQKRYEAIPTPGAIFYNATVAKVLRKPETKIANDIAAKMGKGTVLDLGSGTGYLSIEIARRSPSLQVYGIDLSRQMIKIARRQARGVDNARFVFGNADGLPFEDDSVDFIVSTGSLHHWKKPAKVFDECYRVLKTGKEAWIYDGCPDAHKGQAGRIRSEYGFLLYRIGAKVAGLHGFTREEYRTVMKGVLEETAFKGNYQMEITDIWMKITLQKRQ
jgi:ubiquinone/menaquinone biosynthesis C-methylase UbiE